MGLMDKFHNLKDCMENSQIYDVYYNQGIDNKIVYMESRNGNDFTGNILRITEELSTGKYDDLKIYVFANENVKRKIERLSKNYNLNIHQIITDEYKALKILQKAKYIFTDSGIRTKFVKKPGQIFTNTWHGTPLKLMGFDNPSERPAIGIIQRSFFFSDYLLFPNDYMEQIMLNAYMMDKIYPGKILHEGYPRNSVFLDNAKKEEFKEKLNFKNYEIFVYMPTFKGVVNDRLDEEQNLYVKNCLNELDVYLKDNQLLFVKFHPYNQSKIDFSTFDHIQPFPQGYENYDILNMADVLITDYSSVLFDFLNTRRKIIIFNYDEKEYMSYRGVYIPIEDLPFPKVQNTSDLIKELNSKKTYDDVNFVNKFCKYESKNSAERICKMVLNNENPSNFKIIDNNNKNILIYVGGMSNNLITQLIKGLNLKNNNIFLSYNAWDDNIKENYMEIFDQFPKGIQFLPLSNNIFPTTSEKLELNKFIKDNEKITPSIKNLFKRSFKRQYGDFKFDKVIDFQAQNIVESLTFAFSGIDNIAIFNENSNKNIVDFFDKSYELTEELIISEIIK